LYFYVTHVFKLSSDNDFYEPKHTAQTTENTAKTVVVTEGLISFAQWKKNKNLEKLNFTLNEMNDIVQYLYFGIKSQLTL
jgi:cytochrome c-type biogenesis protein CcmE